MTQGTLIRPATDADIPAIARIHVDSWRTTYRGIVPDEYLDQLSYDSRERMWQAVLGSPRERHVAYVAEHPDSGVSGFALARSADEPAFDSELMAIYLRAEHQGRGLGRRLTVAVAAELVARGDRSMIVWVLAENPARRFYQALGGRLFRTRTIEIGGENFAEVSFGWDDLTTLTQTAG